MGTPLRFFSDNCWVTPTHADGSKATGTCEPADHTSRADAGRPPETARQTKTTVQTDTAAQPDPGKRGGTASPDRSQLPRRGRWRRTVRNVGVCATSATRCLAGNGPPDLGGSHLGKGTSPFGSNDLTLTAGFRPHRNSTRSQPAPRRSSATPRSTHRRSPPRDAVRFSKKGSLAGDGLGELDADRGHHHGRVYGSPARRWYALAGEVESGA